MRQLDRSVPSEFGSYQVAWFSCPYVLLVLRISLFYNIVIVLKFAIIINKREIRDSSQGIDHRLEGSEHNNGGITFGPPAMQ